MKNTTYKSIFSFIVFGFHFFLIGQEGPGGIGNTNGLSDLKVWYVAENEVFGTNSWTDLSGNGTHATVNPTQNTPIFNSNAINGYSSFSFSNNQFQLNRTISNDYTLVCLFKTQHQGVGYAWWNSSGLIDSEVGGNSKNDFGMNFTSSNRVVAGLFNRNGPGNVSVVSSIGSLNDNLPHIAISTRTVSTGEYTVLTDESNFVKAQNGGNLPRNTNRITIGSNQKNINYFIGYIPEVIIFSKALSEVERIILSNYLSAKYDVTLHQNNFYTNDELINGNFDHNVAGIGQALDGSSHNDSQGTGIVRINNPSSLSNGDYLFWGENNKVAPYDIITNNVIHKTDLNTTWRVNKINDLGTVDVSFDLTQIDSLNEQTCHPIQLIVDNNPNFTNPIIYDLSILGNRATINAVNFSDGDYFKLRYFDKIVWDGNSFYNGSGIDNAPNENDECLTLIVKAGQAADLIYNAHVKDVDVESGAVLNVKNDILLEVDHHMLINGLIDVFGESQIIQNHSGSSSNSGTGALKIRQQGTANLFNYNYWTAPVNRNGSWQIQYLEDANGIINFINSYDANPNTSPISLSMRWLYKFYHTEGQYNGWQSLSKSHNLLPGIGYTMKGSGVTGTSDQEYIFKGIPNDGNYTHLVESNNDFLVGNPYPSSLNADRFITNNLSVISGTLYFWEHFNTNNSHLLSEYEGGYATYNLMMALPAMADTSGLTSGLGFASKLKPTSSIAIAQGFFINTDNTGTLMFNNNQRIFAKELTNDVVFYRNANNSEAIVDDRTKIWFGFGQPFNYSKFIGLGFDERATLNYDKGFDGESFEIKRNDFYWLLNNKKLAIQALARFNVEDVLSLGVKIADTGIYNFSIVDHINLPNNVSIYLRDNQNGQYYNLLHNDVQIYIESGDYQDRFDIVFQEQEILSDNDFISNIIDVRFDNKTNTLLIDGKGLNIENLSVYNTFGQLIKNLSVSKTSEMSYVLQNIASGIYVLKIQVDKNISAHKFIKN